MRPILPQIRQFAEAVRLAMARKGWGRKTLSHQAQVSDGAIGKVLAGKSVHNTTVLKIARALRIDIKSVGGSNPSSDTGWLSTGGYTRFAVSSYEGIYLTARPSLDGSAKVKIFTTTLQWNEELECLTFKEADRDDSVHAHSGRVFMPVGAPFIFFVSGGSGWIRTVTLSPLSTAGEMRGTITAIWNVSGPMYMPSVVPIFYRGARHMDHDLIGAHSLSDPKVSAIVEQLRETSSKYVKFALV